MNKPVQEICLLAVKFTESSLIFWSNVLQFAFAVMTIYVIRELIKLPALRKTWHLVSDDLKVSFCFWGKWEFYLFLREVKIFPILRRMRIFEENGSFEENEKFC
jgi:hypothetical protein